MPNTNTMKSERNKIKLREILVAEDSATQAIQIKHLLENNGYKVIVTSDGKNAVNSLKKNKPALVISDIVMPEINGYELCKSIKSNIETSQIPVILLTRLKDPEEIIEGLSCGADSFITKPYVDSYLLSHIEKLLSEETSPDSKKVEFGTEIIFRGKKHFIQAEQQNVIKLMLNIYEGAIQQNEKLIQTQEELRLLNAKLESFVEDRTNDLFEEIKLSKEIAQSYKTSEEKYRTLFENSTVGIYRTTPDGRVLLANPALVKMLGYSSFKELSNRNLEEMGFEPSYERSHFKDIMRNEGQIYGMETAWTRSDGTILFVSESAKSIKSKNGEILYYDGIVEDITKRKKAEFQIKKLNEELEERVIKRTKLLETANKELEAFSYSVSHDLRAPLRAVHGYTKILKEDYYNKLDDEGKRICDVISSSATKMGELIDDLLSFSRIGRSDLSPSVIDMKKMTEVIFEGLTSPEERERVKFKVGKLKKVAGDAKLIGQVWTNLISNAIKYTSKNEVAEISIGLTVSEKMVTYFIKDNGVGFDMQYGHKLFGVFQRLHSETEFEGNGVGLAIVQRIILKHGGKVWADGEVGKGATFYFTLPSEAEYWKE
jgi:PAS domain S-box-containing protein